jgi:hypothetical protein
MLQEKGNTSALKSYPTQSCECMLTQISGSDSAVGANTAKQLAKGLHNFVTLKFRD